MSFWPSDVLSDIADVATIVSLGLVIALTYGAARTQKILKNRIQLPKVIPELIEVAQELSTLLNDKSNVRSDFSRIIGQIKRKLIALHDYSPRSSKYIAQTEFTLQTYLNDRTSDNLENLNTDVWTLIDVLTSDADQSLWRN